MSKYPQLLSELLRPQQLGDLTISQKDIERLQRMAGSGDIMDMIFYGEPGTGKTSAARILIGAIGVDHPLEVNGSSANGIDYIRDKIAPYAQATSVLQNKKLVFVDEADGLSRVAQSALRYVIENKRNARFIFTANNIGKLSEAIQSRMLSLCFDISPENRIEVLKRLNERYQTKLGELGIQYDKDRLSEIMGLYYPDFRAIANRLEYEFAFA
jgi:replication-associated recombination protein RarA